MSPDLDARFIGDEEYRALKAESQAFLETFKMLVKTKSLTSDEQREMGMHIKFWIEHLVAMAKSENTTLDEIKEEVSYSLVVLKDRMREIFLWRVFDVTGQDIPYISIPEHDVV